MEKQNRQKHQNIFMSVKNIVNTFSSVSLKEINSAALLKRTDTKFVIYKEDLVPVLEEINKDYKVLEINKDRVMTYNSLYFDTKNNKFYNDHHNGKVKRIKIRMRKYVESNRCFLEIKQKDGLGRTNKTRTAISDFEINPSAASTDFIRKTTLRDYDLIPAVWIQFNRFTLVNRIGKERVTVDLNLSFNINGSKKAYENIVIIEVKQERYNRDSSIVRTLRKYRSFPYGISKYCIGMISLYADFKYNAFKSKLLKINKAGA